MEHSAVESKHNSEQRFHDDWAERISLDELLVHESFEAATAVENRFALETFGDLKGKKLLDLGCGAGETSVYFALKGAEVTAIDISPKMINVVQKLAEKHNVKLDARTMKAENLELPNDHFDFIFGNGVLHHVVLEPALMEVRRVLKSTGKAIFIEPLSYNPVIEVYRHLAKTVRTETEKPFSFKQLEVMRKYFSKTSHREFWLFTLSLFLYFFLVERSNPSKDRYWKKVIKDSGKHETLFKRLFALDEFVLRRIPGLGRLCWNTVLTLEK